MPSLRPKTLVLALAALAVPSAAIASTVQNAKESAAVGQSTGDVRKDKLGAFPTSWYFTARQSAAEKEAGAPPKRRGKAWQLEGRKAPALNVEGWIGDEIDLAKAEGKIIVVDFWGTWCGPCMAALPKNVSIAEKYGSRDVVVLGIHSTMAGPKTMAQAKDENGISYPLAKDVDRKTAKDWKVSFWPTYVVIDHEGYVRGAGLRPEYVESAVKKLVEERDRAKSG